MSSLVVIFFFVNLTYTLSVAEVSTNNRHLLAFRGIPAQPLDDKVEKNEEKSKEKVLTINVNSEKVEEKPPEVSTKNRHLRVLSGIPAQPDDDKVEKNEEKNKEKKVLTINVSSEKVDEKSPEVKKVKSTTEAPKNETKIDHKVYKPTEMESGALLRGVSVVVILTALVIVYMALKTYCGRRNKHPVMVNKYGVRTRRSDIEMTPLPLDDDEEDETLFEVGNTNR